LQYLHWRPRSPGKPLRKTFPVGAEVDREAVSAADDLDRAPECALA
jgi:hypothetical protein